MGGWITDAGGRDSSILTETLDADPDAASIEERLLAAVKAVSSDTKLNSSGGSAHAVKKSETKEHEKASPKKRVDSEDEDEDDEKKTIRVRITSLRLITNHRATTTTR